MIFFTGPWLGARLRVLLIATISIFLAFHLYIYVDYKALRFGEVHAPVNTAKHMDTTSTILTPTGMDVSTTAGVSPSPEAHKTGQEPLGALIAAAMHAANVSWMYELADNWTLYPYVVDDSSPPAELQIPQNKGHEAMVYLTFIITHWDNLPPRAVFLHGHRTSWHQEGDMVSLIRSLRLPALDVAGYIPLRCDWYPSCPAEIRPITHDAIQWGPGVHREDAENGIAEAWDTLFPGVELPQTIASQCCAQFAVTRNAILRREKAVYERMRDWILNTTLIDDVSGRVLEKLWAYIMTNDTIHCPPPQQCACDYFGQCELRNWPTPPEGLSQWPPE